MSLVVERHRKLLEAFGALADTMASVRIRRSEDSLRRAQRVADATLCERYQVDGVTHLDEAAKFDRHAVHCRAMADRLKA